MKFNFNTLIVEGVIVLVINLKKKYLTLFGEHNAEKLMFRFRC